MTHALVAALVLGAAPRLALVPVGAGEGVPEKTAASLTEALAAEVRRATGAEVLTPREIQGLLSFEKQKEMLGCTSDGCLAELGGALGVGRLVAGELSKLGESWLVHLKVLDVAKARVVGQADRRLRGGSLDDVLDALPGMVGEVFGTATPTPTPITTTLPSRPVPLTADEPVRLNPVDRARMRVYTDGAGHFVATIPFAAGGDAPFFYGDRRRLFAQRIFSSSSEGTIRFSRAFWEPRASRPADAYFEASVAEGAKLVCGERTTAYRALGMREAHRFFAAATFHAPRWRRHPHVLARDDEGSYWFVDGPRGADGRPAGAERRLLTGRKGALTAVAVQDVLEDGGGTVVISAAGRLEVKQDAEGRPQAAWATPAGRKALVLLDPADHGPLVYGALGAYPGAALGTPCDGVFSKEE